MEDFGITSLSTKNNAKDCLEFLSLDNISKLNEQNCMCLCSSILKCHEEVSNLVYSHTKFSIIISLLEHESQYVSYLAKEILVAFYSSFISQKKKRKLKTLLSSISQEVLRYVENISGYRSVNDLAMMHMTELLIKILSEETQCEATTELKQFLIQHWIILLNYGFSRTIPINHSKNQCLIYSTIRMYVKLIKSDLEVNLEKDFKFALAQYLLNKMKFGEMPEVCLRKALVFVWHCCPEFDAINSNQLLLKNVFRNCVLQMFLMLVELKDGVSNHYRSFNSSSNTKECLSGDIKSSFFDIVTRNISCHVFIGQGNFHELENKSESCNFLLLRTILLIITKCMAFLAMHEFQNSSTPKMETKATIHKESLTNDIETQADDKPWNSGFSFIFNIVEKLFPCKFYQHKQLINIFCDQDDDMIKFLLYFLHAALLSGDDDLVVDSHLLFLKMLLTIGWNHLVLVDWLVSPETEFIKLLLKQLKCILSKPQQWNDACHLFDKKCLSCKGNLIYGQTNSTSHHKQNASNNQLTGVSEVSGIVNQLHSFNLTAYSDTDEDDYDNPTKTNCEPVTSKPVTGENSCNFNNHLVNDPAFNSSSFGLIKNGNSCLSLSFMKTKNTLIATAESIKKFRSAGAFPYNPASLLKLLHQFNDSLLNKI